MATGVAGVDLVAAIATDAITYTGIGVATKTVTIGNVVYTARATPGAEANAYKIGADVTTQAQYLAECINASGTAANFGTATVAHPYMSAANTAGVVALTCKIAGDIGGGVHLATDETNAAVAAAYMDGCAGTDGSGALSTALANAKTGVLDPKSKTLNFINEII
jgi:hypothetical protein